MSTVPETPSPQISESAFIHDPGGIENLCYNAGAKGHVSGAWHSMKED